MDLMRMRVAETELSLEESPTGVLRVVRRYRPGVLVREAARGLVGGLVSVAVLTALGGALGREWAVVVGGIAVCGWISAAVVLVRTLLAGGPCMEVAELPSRWSRLSGEALSGGHSLGALRSAVWESKRR